jgi:hypothetical protein
LRICRRRARRRREQPQSFSFQTHPLGLAAGRMPPKREGGQPFWMLGGIRGLAKSWARPPAALQNASCLFKTVSGELAEWLKANAGHCRIHAAQFDRIMTPNQSSRLLPEKAMNGLEKRSEAAEADRIRDSERRRLRALIDGDLEAACKLHAENFQLITPSGRSLSRDEYLGEIGSGHLKYLIWEPAEIAVQLHDKVALIRYQSDLEVVSGGRHVPRARYWHTDSYEQREGRWQVVWSQATEVRFP